MFLFVTCSQGGPAHWTAAHPQRLLHHQWARQKRWVLPLAPWGPGVAGWGAGRGTRPQLCRLWLLSCSHWKIHPSLLSAPSHHPTLFPGTAQPSWRMGHPFLRDFMTVWGSKDLRQPSGGRSPQGMFWKQCQDPDGPPGMTPRWDGIAWARREGSRELGTSCALPWEPLPGQARRLRQA